MKNKEVIRRILDYHPHFENYVGCDDWKWGDPEAECTGVVCALTPSVEVIRKTAQLGANLLIVHEPTFYTSLDEPGWFEDFPNRVFDEKKDLLDAAGIAVWRDHDHMHANRPDSIFTGVVKYMGWEPYAKPEKSVLFGHYIITLPEAVTLEELCRHVKDTLNLNGVRYIGNPQARVRTLAIVGHLYPMPLRATRSDGKPLEYSVQIIDTMERKADVILPGEVIDWTCLSYVRDAAELGKNKGVINIGHFNWEELGMRYARDWLSDLVREVPVHYVPSGDMYRFYTE